VETQRGDGSYVCAGGSIVGLIEALQDWLDAYFEARRKNGGETCKGEDECGEDGRPDGGRGLKGAPDSVEEICAKCPFFPTKPGAAPAYLDPLISMAYKMEALFEAGAGVEYPNFYTPLEWEAFLTLKYARAKADQRDLPTPNSSAQKNYSNAAVQAALGARLKK
jgi:hypothetical protein